MTNGHDPLRPGGHIGPMRSGPAATTAPVWIARRCPGAAGPPETPGAARWGLVYLPADRVMLFASEMRCRSLAARLAGKQPPV